MMEDRYSPEQQEIKTRTPEARYAYYRRCQVFRKGGEQCKAPAEKGSHICYAHAGQLATAVRRERELRAVLEKAVAQMRKRGRPECEMADLFIDFKGINMTLAVMAKAVIDGRVDCKTAGRLVVQLQTFSKLLWQIHRKGRKDRKENRISPQIYADERRLGKEEKASTTKNTKEHEGQKNLPLIHTDATDLKKSAEEARLPQIYADERRLNRPGEKPSLTAEALRRVEEQKNLPLIHTDATDLKKPGLNTQTWRHRKKPSGGDRAANHLPATHLSVNHRAMKQREEIRMALVAKVLAVANRRDWPHALPELLRAA